MAEVGTVVITYGTKVPNERSRIRSVRFAWTSDAAGDASGFFSRSVNGKNPQAVIIPGLSGVQPSDNYDVTLIDEDGRDLLGGAGANRDNVNVESVSATVAQLVDDSTLELRIANAGNAKSGVVVIYFE